MLANVLQMEALALSTAAKYREGAAIFIDFKAAFPSISHDYLHKCLQTIGFPPSALRVVEPSTRMVTVSYRLVGTLGQASKWSPALDRAARFPRCSSR